MCQCYRPVGQRQSTALLGDLMRVMLWGPGPTTRLQWRRVVKSLPGLEKIWSSFRPSLLTQVLELGTHFLSGQKMSTPLPGEILPLLFEIAFAFQCERRRLGIEKLNCLYGRQEWFGFQRERLGVATQLVT